MNTSQGHMGRFSIPLGTWGKIRYRRKELQLTQLKVARSLGVAQMTLHRWEMDRFPKSLPAHYIVGLERVLRREKDWLLGEHTSPIPGTDPNRRTEIIILSDTLAAAIIQLARVLARWDTRCMISNEATVSAMAEHNALIFATRYGITGQRSTQFTAIAKQHGITKQRARQIATKLLNKTARLTIRVPVIDRLAQTLKTPSPRQTDVLDLTLRRFLGGELTLEDANRFCIGVLARQLTSRRDCMPHHLPSTADGRIDSYQP